ncbi:MAG: lipopolysaccharide assembly protein LapA domain-containing protein [Pseudomonadota bacterium]|uniref:lipopolysaccharide assembly protein LapA domain-containing protein n=1 Tax=Sphingomonas sp. ERG5 TaxID=1381597 RepID=UPI00054B7040|nr:lipopolysaccharide assembly protein LapA domain-containing protein [Sphingomonas sp. ERG5]
MQFLKILFWCLLAFIAALFTIGNWTTVSLKLWGGLVAEVNLPLLLFVTFLIGFVPAMAYYRTILWRLRNRLSTSQRAMTDLRDATAAPPPPALTPDPEPPLPAPSVPPAAVPTAVPPGVA